MDEDKNLADKYKNKHLQIYESGKSVPLLRLQSGFWILVECFIIGCDMLDFPSLLLAVICWVFPLISIDHNIVFPSEDS